FHVTEVQTCALPICGVRRCDEQGAGLAVWRGGPLVSALPRKSRPWHLWLIVVVATFFMSVGLYDFVMVATRNQAYLTDRYTSARSEQRRVGDNLSSE